MAYSESGKIAGPRFVGPRLITRHAADEEMPHDVSTRDGYSHGGQIYEEHESTVEFDHDSYSASTPFKELACCRRVHLILCLTIFGLSTSLSTVFYVLTRYSQISADLLLSSAHHRRETATPITRIAFGSNLQRNVDKQPVWQAVINSKPHLWIWLGDFVYANLIDVDCDDARHSDYPGCQCAGTYLKRFPSECYTGDLENARPRYQRQLAQDEFRQFLNYMCANGSTGPDCTRPILGTWDDHEYLWINGNKRLPNKNSVKSLFLDAVGERQGSPRRNTLHGLEYSYVFNKGDPKREITIFLLDERYYRDPLPCEHAWAHCEAVLKEDAQLQSKELRKWRTFCEDFRNRGEGCCSKNEFMFDKSSGWCAKHANDEPAHEDYEELCNPQSSFFGSRLWTINETDNSVSPGGVQADSPFCDILGHMQRNWLRQSLSVSHSIVNIIASPSAFLTSSTQNPNDSSWGPYPSAQNSLISSLIQTSASCIVILAGDRKYADLRVLKPDKKSNYSTSFGTERLKYPIYQVMASGMTDGAMLNDHQDGDSASRPLQEDPDGWRSSPDAYTNEANFGSIDFDWFKGTMTLQVRLAQDSSVAIEEVVNLSNCSKTQRITDVLPSN